MPFVNQAPTGNGLTRLSNSALKQIDWADLFKKVCNNGTIPTANQLAGTVSISSDFAGQKDEGKMKVGSVRWDIQSVSETYANCQLQVGAQSVAAVLLKTNTAYTWAAITAEMVTSTRDGVIRKDQ